MPDEFGIQFLVFMSDMLTGVLALTSLVSAPLV